MGAKTDRELIYRQSMMDEIRRLIEREADFATKNRKPFRDDGDVVGPLEEEYRETRNELLRYRQTMNTWMNETFEDDQTFNTERFKTMFQIAVRGSMEFMQLGAVALKALNQSKDWE